MTINYGSIVDRLWANALGRIVPGQPTSQLRTRLGDQIDTFIMQAATSRLVSTNPGFSKVLYTAAYDSAERNGYFIIRRLGMPTDFFWKFDLWSRERAFKTLKRVVDRVFAALLVEHAAGQMDVVSVDVERARFELTFTDCAECMGAQVSRPACFFHAGLFAGIIGSMLDRRMHAIETQCAGTGDGPCRFTIGEDADRIFALSSQEALEAGSPRYTALPLTPMLGADRATVDVGYYQLLLGTAFLPNLDVLEIACLDAGRQTGHEIAKQVTPAESPKQTVAELFSGLRYMDLEIIDSGDGVTTVRADEAPESLGELSKAAVVPFFCGEIESLLNDLTGARVKFDSIARDEYAGSLLIRFVPQA